ncbi:MAG: hypothetical protein MUF15_01150 [Acidobacteria bacterium]|nr:hypothetical protein [Acidobacteriota bacterium]
MEFIVKNPLILEKQKEDVVIIGQTQQKQPVITYRKYGNGHILVLTTPVASIKSGSEIMAQLLLNAVNSFSKRYCPTMWKDMIFNRHWIRMAMRMNFGFRASDLFVILNLTQH